MKMLLPLSLSAPGREFHCPCHGGTRFVVHTTAEIPYASCPVCGSVCEPYVPPYLFMRLGLTTVRST